jgi:hypothetical protein
MTNTEIPAEKRELNDELTLDELEVVSGGDTPSSGFQENVETFKDQPVPEYQGGGPFSLIGLK